MSGEGYLAILVIGVALWVAYYYWNLSEYPEIACSKCHGAGRRVKWIFHLSSLRRRRVRGPCHRCNGSSWASR